MGRTVATVLGRLRLPMARRHKAYLDHGPIGATELEDLGCEPLVVQFARSHHGPPPAGIDPDDWATLVAIDRA